MISKLRKFLYLENPDKLMLCRALFILPVIAILLRLLGLNRSVSILSFLNSKNPGILIEQSGVYVKKAYRISWLVDIATRYGIFRANCLQRSLVLWLLLRQRGIQSEIHFGTRKNNGKFEAHAWVELDGLVLNDSEDVTSIFTPFDCAINP
ncbi:MAG: lasso peptide biosynthesis B2 protein [Acidobacteriota bacterium]|nr:MAG: lasso peptide biosynthesis B2 protein [Acidobacteriota bacterium]